MQADKTNTGSGQNPIFLILVLALGLAAIAALAPDFEVPNSSRTENLSKQAKRWSALDYYSENNGGYQISAARWTQRAFN